MSKTVLDNVDGFTPVVDSLAREHGLVSAAVFGRVWRYCQGDKMACNASMENIGAALKLDRATVMRHVEKLVGLGYLEDLTPTLRNRPHTYRDTGKAGNALSAGGVAQNNTTVAESYTTVAESNSRGVAESHMKKEVKKQIKREVKKGEGANAPRPRNPLFDAIAEVTQTDTTIKGSGGHIAKVCAALSGADQPYTPEDVRKFGELWWAEKWHSSPPTVGQLQQQIGRVRQNGNHRPDHDPRDNAPPPTANPVGDEGMAFARRLAGRR